jgi:hypothetical protein
MTGGRAASPRRPLLAGSSEIYPYQVDAPDGPISSSLGETASVRPTHHFLAP